MNRESHLRHSIRLPGYDYTQPGTYFITLVTQGRKCLFGDVIAGEVILNQVGRIVSWEWQRLERRFPEIETRKYIVMPNHFHGIIVIGCRGTALESQSKPGDQESRAHSGMPLSEKFGQTTLGSIPTMVGAFKTEVTRKINTLMKTPGRILWQRNYFEHIIRNDEEWDRIRIYIESNPTQWAKEIEDPENFPK